MSYQITPLFSVEGQRMEAIKELKKHPLKMAVVLEYEQERTGRIQYTYELLKIQFFNVGQEWPAMPGWVGKIRAVVFPWEIESKSVQIYHIHNYESNQS
ncbi:hypothetical protein GVN20_05670 [Runella sp. CRIBMP]|uniref:hypothetical protein n=1 Tax=Runella sp. CRIBMP TaxID=2683261 RepID=UPI0014136C39|nr:hypothetical protein [Runella sp. CRIBMP]NBB18838.1 hypothetical protein [Runella sp. CRIBMP]